MNPLKQVLKPIASLRLTVILFALAMVLILSGTLAQVHEGVWTVVARYFRSLIVRIDFQLFVPTKVAHIPGGIIFPGGFLIAGIMLVNLLAAHTVRFKFAPRRIGIIVTHLGVILLLVGEFVTGLAATEGNMNIDANGTSNYVEDIRRAELAVIDSSSPADDFVVVIPERLLSHPEPVSSSLLPFQVRVDQWMPNSHLLGPMQSTPEQRAKADSGEGKSLAAIPAPRVTGVDAATTDVPSAYITLSRDGKRLGSYLVSVYLDEPQDIEVAGKTYGLQLRFKRTYKPYTVHLLEFKHDKFVGTETPRNFSSLIQLTDPTNHVDRQVLIRMNSPLRYAGETFYQASFKPDDSGTVLQVVRNPGWLLPYISCAFVAIGMLLHFVPKLVPVLRRAAAKAPTAQVASARGPAPSALLLASPSAPSFYRLVPLITLLLAAAYLITGLIPARQSTPINWDNLGRIPISAQGRTKPLDSFARNTLMQLSGRQTVGPAATPAIQWLTDALASPEKAATAPVFRIDHPDVLTLLGLSADQKRFSLNDLRPKLDEILKQAQLADAIPAKQQDPFQRQIMDLHRRLTLYFQISQFEAPYAIAPLKPSEEWRPIAAAANDQALLNHPSFTAYRDILTAYAKDDAPAVNTAVSAYLSTLGEQLPQESRRAGYEVAFNRFEPFYRASALYVLAFLLAGFGFITGVLSRGHLARSLARSTVAILLLALTVHTIGIISRIYLQGRPPVTNLYSSAVFIGFIGVIIGLILEWIYKLGLGSIVASVIGFATLVIAHNLSTTGDTMEMMQAVLDTNFWLATHVVVVTIGYSATFLAGFLGIAYIALGLFTPFLRATGPGVDAGAHRTGPHQPGPVSDGLGKTLPKTIYGVICFAALASFVGTVLGGIWADQSWGRFWGWDPKENGAALIVLMNLLTLHARFGGLVQARGIAILAVCGNIVTAWSWFGTNMLGVGLHSYGFMASAAFYLAAFMLLQLAIALIGLIPQRRWRSFRHIRAERDRAAPTGIANQPA